MERTSAASGSRSAASEAARRARTRPFLPASFCPRARGRRAGAGEGERETRRLAVASTAVIRATTVWPSANRWPRALDRGFREAGLEPARGAQAGEPPARSRSGATPSCRRACRATRPGRARPPRRRRRKGNPRRRAKATTARFNDNTHRDDFLSFVWFPAPPPVRSRAPRPSARTSRRPVLGETATARVRVRGGTRHAPVESRRVRTKPDSTSSDRINGRNRTPCLSWRLESPSAGASSGSVEDVATGSASSGRRERRSSRKASSSRRGRSCR